VSAGGAPGRGPHGRAPAAAVRRGAARVATASPPAPPLPLRHPATLAAAAAAAACVFATVTFHLTDTDLWQHLVVGREIWRAGVPHEHLWSWPTFGTPEVTPSWGFRALLWPLWDRLGVTGLFVWRWATTLAAFGLLWAAARRMGARGLTPLVVAAWCALVYRQRSQVRPETLVAVLFAAQLLIHEARRAAVRVPADGGPPLAHARRDPALLLPLVALAWANVHISYWMGLALQAVYLLDAWLANRRAPRGAPDAAPARLVAVAVASVAVSFLNPGGARALAQPFEYWFTWRHEPIYAQIAELHPVYWSANLRNGLPLLLAVWAALAVRRVLRREADLPEILLGGTFVTLGLGGQRFMGFVALLAGAFLARDLDAWVRARAWPRWTARAWPRAGLAAAACVAVSVAEWREPTIAPGVGVDEAWLPVAACDAMRDAGVRGRGFNHFFQGGYLLWRFYPDRGRLPFMDIHQSGTREDRRLYALVATDPRAWAELDRRHRFDWVLLNRFRPEGDRALDHLDADTSFALVFLDDNAALYVRRAGPMAAVARTHAYTALPAGGAATRALGARAAADTAFRARLAREITRMAEGSPWNASAHSLLANLAALEGRWEDARASLRRALARDPLTLEAHARLAHVALALDRPAEALRHARAERALAGRSPSLDALEARARTRLRALEARARDLEAARRRAPDAAGIEDSLRAVRARLSAGPP